MTPAQATQTAENAIPWDERAELSPAQHAALRDLQLRTAAAERGMQEALTLIGAFRDAHRRLRLVGIYARRLRHALDRGHLAKLRVTVEGLQQCLDAGNVSGARDLADQIQRFLDHGALSEAAETLQALESLSETTP